MSQQWEKRRQEQVREYLDRIEALEQAARREAERRSEDLVHRIDKQRGLGSAIKGGKLGRTSERRIDRLSFDHYLAMARAKRAGQVRTLQRKIARLSGVSQERHHREPLILTG